MRAEASQPAALVATPERQSRGSSFHNERQEQRSGSTGDAGVAGSAPSPGQGCVFSSAVAHCKLIGALALFGSLSTSGCVGQQWTPKEPKGASSGLSSIDGPQEGSIDYDTGEPGGAAQVRLELERRHQTLDGFGAAVAWYQDRITGKTPEGLYETLFPKLGIDLIRFRNRFQRLEKDDRNTKQEVEIFERATEAYGYRPKLLLSSWSPPAAIKKSGQERCKSNDDCTLKKQGGKFVYEEFAQYWVDSLREYRQLGLAPDFVSIQNEPSFIPPDWEGCKFTAEETDEYPGYGKALDHVYRALQKVETPPKLIGPEVLGIHYDRVQKYLAHIDSRQLYAVAHHLYERGDDGIWDWRYPGPQSFVDEMMDVGASTHKPLWQSEFGTDEDKGYDGGFETAWLIHASLVDEGITEFIYWDLIWDGNRGLVGMLGRRPLVRDQYFSMRHFARYTDPGYTRVHTTNDQEALRSSAWISPDGKQLTVVVLNTGEQMLDVSFDFDTFTPATTRTFRTTYRPRESDRWRSLGSAGQASVLRMPGRSVATVALER